MTYDKIMTVICNNKVRDPVLGITNEEALQELLDLNQIKAINIMADMDYACLYRSPPLGGDVWVTGYLHAYLRRQVCSYFIIFPLIDQPYKGLDIIAAHCEMWMGLLGNKMAEFVDDRAFSKWHTLFKNIKISSSNGDMYEKFNIH